MDQRIQRNGHAAPSRTADSECGWAESQHAGSGLVVDVIDLGDAYLLPGDEIRDSLLRWQYVDGRLVYDEVRRAFIPHPSGSAVSAGPAQPSAVGGSYATPADGRSADPAAPASGPVVVAGPDVTPGGAW